VSRRTGYTVVELAVAAGVFSLVLYILMMVTSLAKTYFLSGQLAHATQGALLLASELEDDLRQAVRDPNTGKALVVAAVPRPSIAFYREVGGPDDMRMVVVPVRWSVMQDAAAETGYLARTTWDPAKETWDTHAFRWAPIPLPGAGGGTIGLRVSGDAASAVQTLLVTVMAREKRLEGVAGAANDRVTIQLAVGVPQQSLYAAPLFKSLKTIEELPQEP
jgi:hypothetical protein